MKKHIPNTLTLLNLFCGCAALVALFAGENTYIFWFLGIGLIADVLDGAVARLLRVSSPMGKELDSLADMVSFGIAPAAIFYVLLAQHPHGPMVTPGFHPQYLPAFAIALFAALRLAKFNLDSRQSDNFLGLPTPSTTMFAVGLLWIRHFENPYLLPLATTPALLWGIVLGLSLLMVAEVSMFSLKIKSLGWEGNEIRVIFTVATIILAGLWGLAALSLVILTYIVTYHGVPASLSNYQLKAAFVIMAVIVLE